MYAHAFFISVDADIYGKLANPINQSQLLERIRIYVGGDKEKVMPDSIVLPEPIREIGLYELEMHKSGKTFEGRVWVVRK